MILFAFAVIQFAYFYTGFMGKMSFIPETVQGLNPDGGGSAADGDFRNFAPGGCGRYRQSDSITSGSNREGMFYAARTFAFKLGQSLSMLIFTAVSTIGAGEGTGYRIAAFGAAVFCMVGGIILVFYNRRDYGYWDSNKVLKTLVNCNTCRSTPFSKILLNELCYQECVNRDDCFL